jgi:Tol biopolymer transport system component
MAMTSCPGTPVCVSCKARNADGSEGADSDGASSAPVVSADGRYVAFQTSAKNLVPGAPSPCPSAQQIVLADLLTGINQRMATPASAATCGSVGASKPEMDWSGRKLVFETDQPLDANDAGTTPDVYFIDLIGNSLSRISQTLGGTSPNGISTAPRISGDGSTITFVSDATDLDLSQTDTDTFTDVHIRSLRAGEKFPRRLAKAQDGSQSNGNSNRPALNYNGTQLALRFGRRQPRQQRRPRHPERIPAPQLGRHRADLHRRLRLSCVFTHVVDTRAQVCCAH